MPRSVASILTLLASSAAALANDPNAVERGKKALFERSYTAAMWKMNAYEDAWQTWGLKEAPKDYARAFMDHYGRHPAPFDHGRYPIGLRRDSTCIGAGR